MSSRAKRGMTFLRSLFLCVGLYDEVLFPSFEEFVVEGFDFFGGAGFGGVLVDGFDEAGAGLTLEVVEAVLVFF